MKFTSIVTHPGGAHKDEFLACCVLLSVHPAPVHRREPTAADLEDVAVCVVDVGHEHASGKHNFDHHQLPKDHPPTCSLSLVLQHLGLYDDARSFCDWLEPAEWFDCRGAKDTAIKLGVPREAVNQLSSPIDVTLLRRFALSNVVQPGEPVWEVMRMIGTDLVDYVRSLRARLDFIGEHCEFWDLAGGGQGFKVLYLPRTSPLPDEPSMGLERFLESHALNDQVVGLVYPDRRGEGHGLSRYRDDLRMDFTRLKDEPDVHFAHARGFVAKTTASQTDRLKELIAAAWVG